MYVRERRASNCRARLGKRLMSRYCQISDYLTARMLIAKALFDSLCKLMQTRKSSEESTPPDWRYNPLDGGQSPVIMK